MNKKTVFLLILLLMPLITVFFNLPMATATETTFTSETIDGTITWLKSSYPPDTTGSGVAGDSGNWFRVGQTLFGDYYYSYRGYVSFDTSALPEDAEVSSAILQLKTNEDLSDTDFVVRVYGGSQPIWGDSLTTGDWDCGTVLLDSWETVDYVDETYFNFDISADQISKTGRTQFEIVSNREYDDTTPVGDEYVYFHTSESTGNEPKLVITYTITTPTGSMKQTIGDNWLFAQEWHEFEATYTYGGTFDTVKLGFSDLYDANSLLFDGADDSVDIIGIQLEPPNITDLTISIWFQTSADTSGDVTDVILATYAWDKGGYTFDIYNNKASFAVYGGARAQTNDVINDGEWHYLVGTMNYTSWIYSCYLDGVFQISHQVPAPQRAKTAITGIRLGNAFGGSNYLTGSLDQLSLFDRILRQSEMDYNQVHYKPQDRLNLVGMWHMDEGSGTDLYDISIYGYTGTINDATWQDGNLVIDDDHWVITSYDVVGDEWTLDSGSNIVTIQEGSYEQVGEDFIVTYEIFFKDSILDRLDVDVYAYSINTTGTVDYWTEIATDYFNIYNLGGFAVMETQNTAGRIEGGDVFDFYADGADAWVRVDQTYRKIQHVKILAGFVTKDNTTTDDVYVRYGIDFIDPTTKEFITGWNCLINLTDVQSTRDANSYAVLEVRWYYNDVQIGTTDTFYSMWEGLAFATPDGEYSGTRFHLDLWFNKVNGSSVVGGRVSPYMYGLTKSDPAWWDWFGWFGTAEWKPLRTNATESFLFTNLEDYTGETITSKALDLTRFYCNLTNVGANDDIYVMNYRTFDFTFAAGDMEGINTPPFPETLDPELPAGGGILAGLFAQIKALAGSISDAVTSGVLRVWSSFVSFLDTIAEWMGVPGAFSNFVDWISSGWTYLTNSMTYFLDLIVHTFTMIGEGMTHIVQLISHMANYWVQMLQTFKEFLQEGWGTGTNIWNGYIAPVVPLLVICYPLVLFFIWADRGTQALFNHLKMLMDIGSFLIHLFISTAQLVLSVITGLIEAIPIVE